MFWRRSKNRTDSGAEQAEREQRKRAELKKRLTDIFAHNRDSEFTMRHLESKLGPVSLASMSLALAELQQEGVVDRVLRVESPENHGGIEDFVSLSAIPEQIYDWRSERMVEVTPDNIVLIFKAHHMSELAAAHA
jgi:hypothetical protein